MTWESEHRRYGSDDRQQEGNSVGRILRETNIILSTQCRHSFLASRLPNFMLAIDEKKSTKKAGIEDKRARWYWPNIISKVTIISCSMPSQKLKKCRRRVGCKTRPFRWKKSGKRSNRPCSIKEALRTTEETWGTDSRALEIMHQDQTS